jgi:hypothetical protein
MSSPPAHGAKRSQGRCHTLAQRASHGHILRGFDRSVATEVVTESLSGERTLAQASGHWRIAFVSASAACAPGIVALA